MLYAYLTLIISLLSMLYTDKLVDGENHTWDPEHMWLAPFTAGEAAKVTAQPGFGWWRCRSGEKPFQTD